MRKLVTEVVRPEEVEAVEMEGEEGTAAKAVDR